MTSSIEKVIAQMMAHGLPPLPPHHPVCDGKRHKYGPQKKAWYIAFAHITRSGQQKITGAFGIWHGSDNGKVKIEADFSDVTEEDLADMRRKQREHETRQAAVEERAARMAAGRAAMQWKAAGEIDNKVSAYL